MIIKLDTTNPWPNGDTVPVSAYDAMAFMANPVVMSGGKVIGKVVDHSMPGGGILAGDDEIMLNVKLDKPTAFTATELQCMRWVPTIKIIDCHYVRSKDDTWRLSRRIVDKCELVSVSVEGLPVAPTMSGPSRTSSAS